MTNVDFISSFYPHHPLALSGILGSAQGLINLDLHTWCQNKVDVDLVTHVVEKTPGGIPYHSTKGTSSNKKGTSQRIDPNVNRPFPSHPPFQYEKGEKENISYPQLFIFL